MRMMSVAAALVALGLAGSAAAQERFLEDIQIDYDVSVRCAGVYGAAATGKAMEYWERYPDVEIYRGYEQQFARYTQRFGPQLRIPDDVTEDAVSDVRGESFRPVREALFAQDMAGFKARLAALYALIPDCEAERVRLSLSIGIS